MLDGGASLEPGHLHEHMNFVLLNTCFTRSFHILSPT